MTKQNGTLNVQVSVIVPTYKRASLLVDAIRSVQRQSYKNHEIIVVDDNGYDTASGEATAGAIREVGDATVNYIRHEVNMGACAARNTGIRNATGKYVAFLDDDDRWAREFLARLVTALETAEPNVAVAYCGYDSIREGQDIPLFSITVGYSGDVRSHLFEGWCPASTSLFVIRRDALVEAGGFDDQLRSFQDYDLWLRLSKKYEFAFVAAPLVAKLSHSGDQISLNPETRMRGFEYFFEKWNDEFEEQIGEQKLARIRDGILNDIERSRLSNYRAQKEYRQATDSLVWLLRRSSLTKKAKMALLVLVVSGPTGYRYLNMKRLRILALVNHLRKRRGG